MKIAYCILVHRSPNILSKLIRSLNGSGYCFVHVDSKSDMKEFKQACNEVDNVHFVDNRRKVSWAGWSVVQAYMLLLEAAFHSNIKFDRFVLLTGEDYPIMSNKDIVQQFEQNRNIEYVMAYNIAD